MRAPQIVIENGTMPMTETFDALRPVRSTAGSPTSMPCSTASRSVQPPADGAFELHRIGDAVTSRSVHAAIYDALRLCMVL